MANLVQFKLIKKLFEAYLSELVCAISAAQFGINPIKLKKLVNCRKKDFSETRVHSNNERYFLRHFLTPLKKLVNFF